MMRGKKAGELDEHNQPTEPIPRFDPAAFDPTVPAGPGHIVLPAPPSYEQLLPGQYASRNPRGESKYPARQDAYPVLPTPGIRSKGRSPDGAAPVQAGQIPIPARAIRKRYSPIPALVGMCFVAAQLLLLVRFALKILNLATNHLWIGMVYGFSEPLVEPFRTFWQQATVQFHVQIPSSLEIYTLLAILGYGLLSRILVHLLKAIFNSR